MCRLFGFRSVVQSQVHRSLVSAENALAVQSACHTDGWGVAWYLADVPHLIKGASCALQDAIFKRVSGVVASQTVLAHVRKATVGDVHILNSHPFQHGQWTFAHNGEIHAFAANREALLGRVAPALRRFVLGDTDSEVLFYLVLTALQQRTDLHRRGTPIDDVAAAVGAAFAEVRSVCDGAGPGEQSRLTVILTDGKAMVGVSSGKELHFSTWKRHCMDREQCPFVAPECEAPTASGFVNHLILSSEPLQGDNVWEPVGEHAVVGVDHRMRLYRGALVEGVRPVVAVAAA